MCVQDPFSQIWSHILAMCMAMVALLEYLDLAAELYAICRLKEHGSMLCLNYY